MLTYVQKKFYSKYFMQLLKILSYYFKMVSYDDRVMQIMKILSKIILASAQVSGVKQETQLAWFLGN